MKKYFYLFFVMLLGLFISACEDSTDNPVDGNDPDKGSIYIQTTPANAQIWVDNTNSGKTSPDSVTNLSAGTRTVTLKLTGYRDTTFTMTVNKGLQASKSVTLTSSLTFTTFTDTLWENVGTSAAQPSGIDLSAGLAVSTGNSAHDILYDGTNFVFKTSTSRGTVFNLGASSNIDDGTDSPLALNAGQGGWTSQVNDDVTNYFFLYDQDMHYTKMIVTKSGGGTISSGPAWVIVKWYYNTVVNDQRF